ncbi:Alanine racemase [Cellulophaga algicola DSM 14237]|uniref:Alanine racemase n=1 Tax=Cellulophaga algicola (strain DSM 14237 / IC166 / ACAM 630) TaxID=688270 RepID=E6X838_CELAD|nr:alanine racemase [Cellulophaga algicola]ADV48636.1 Alanine racemase [Cellulophaga algicola DSM 14237]
MAKAQETVLEINLTALEHNYRYLKTKISSKTKFLGVVKAFAYGSDAVSIAQKLVALGADYLAVAYTEEGVSLRNAGIKIPILVLHPQIVSFDTIIERCLEPNLYSERILTAFITAAERHQQKIYPIHLKFNTGLNRLGFNAKDIPSIVKKLSETTAVKVLSIFSHLAASEDLEEKDFTLNQIKNFNIISTQIDAALPYIPFKHLANTSGIINYPEAHFDMVRSGIGLYGFGNDIDEDKNFIPVATLKTNISQIHYLEPNESVGYNRAFTSNKKIKTATLPLGHADGIGREYGNGKGVVCVHGYYAPIIGNTCMDMIMVDVTDIDCSEGDEVIVFGNKPTATEFAAGANTISYEVLTGISQRVKRVIVEQQNSINI